MAAPSSVRIIGGKWRGSRLAVVDRDGLRPTGDRVRETLFNWLMARVVGARCLDAFAGSGVLGLEALSRGAESVQAFEVEPAAAKAILDSCNRLGAASYELHCKSFTETSDVRGQQFDIIFLDPPFDAAFAPDVLALIHERELLARDGCIYIERRRSEGPPKIPSGWQLLKSKIAGDVWFGLVIEG